MDARRILMDLRDGRTPDAAALAWFARGLADGTVSDAQAGAFAMAALLRGLGEGGRIDLTRAMRDSGQVLQWDLPGPVLDKHSTGGVGDCVSLLLAPALAVCGAYVPMISGRGLGHTGGTLDKLEAIPGYSAVVDTDRLRDITARLGCAIVGASGNIAPADRRLYGVRDVTGTVESIDLITASILSKKLAAGLDGLVLDVKQGSGAFMERASDARILARALVETARGAGCPSVALITDMDQPLVPSAGNALEIIDVMGTLTGTQVAPSLRMLTCELGGALLALGGLAEDAQDGAARISGALDDGRAAERFAEMVAELGGPVDFLERWRDRLPAAPVVRDVAAPLSGYVQRIDTRVLGMAVVDLGGGRRREDDTVNPAVGLSHLVPLGARLTRGTPLARIHAATSDAADSAERAVLDAYALGDTAPDVVPLVSERLF